MQSPCYILCTEVNPPDGEEAIEWLILTSLELDETRKAEDILRYYLYRWQIEMFFEVLKSGCKIEELQLDNYKRLKVCVAIYFIVA